MYVQHVPHEDFPQNSPSAGGHSARSSLVGPELDSAATVQLGAVAIYCLARLRAGRDSCTSTAFFSRTSSRTRFSTIFTLNS